MSEREDNIERRYMALKSKPGAVEKALGGFHRMTERTYKAFHEIIQERLQVHNITSLCCAGSTNHLTIIIPAASCKIKRFGYNYLRTEQRAGALERRKDAIL